MKTSLEIIEVEYSCSPGGVDEFEVYSTDERDCLDMPLFTSTSLVEAVQYCYNLGRDFTVRTLAEYHERENAYAF
jgi:hypothetical protein